MQYDPNQFIEKIKQETTGRPFPICPFCGHNQFTTVDGFITLPMSKELNNVVLGPSVPVGIMICKQCGHVQLFSLGIMGFINKEEKKNG